MTSVTRSNPEAGGPDRHRGTSIRRLLVQLWIAVFFVSLVVWVASNWFPRVPVPELSGQSRAGAARLEWTLGVDDFGGHFEYQQRSPNSVYPGDEWTPMPESFEHVVPQLAGGLIYVFRIRAVRDGDIAGAPSNEVSVVPLGLTDGSRGMQAQLAALAARVDLLEARQFCRDGTLGELQFEHNSAVVLPTSNDGLTSQNGERLAAIAESLRAAPPEAVAVVRGYASAPGRASYNLDLSEARALAVVEHLSRRLRTWNGKLVVIPEGERPDPIADRTEDDDRRAVVALCPAA